MTFDFTSILRFVGINVGAQSAVSMKRAFTFTELRSQLREFGFQLIYQENWSADPTSENTELFMMFWRSEDGLFVQAHQMGDSIGSAKLHFCWSGKGVNALIALPQVDIGRTYQDGRTWYMSGAYNLDRSSGNNKSLGEFIAVLKGTGKLHKFWKVPHFFWISRDGQTNSAKEIIGQLGRGTQRALRGELMPRFQNLHPDGEMV